MASHYPAWILPGVMQNGWMQPRRVFVLGAGAIGASVGALLFEAGVDCVFVVRDSEHGRAVVERGVDLRFPKAARTIRVPTATTTTATPDDLVLLATMGHETDAALEGVDPRVTVASFQNGVTDPYRGMPTQLGLLASVVRAAFVAPLHHLDFPPAKSGGPLARIIREGAAVGRRGGVIGAPMLNLRRVDAR
jgi:threonine dehydrogenase-like Zn-dependent dehydrogenase